MRLASLISGICLRDIRTLQLSSEEWHYLSSANKAMLGSNLHIDGNVHVSMSVSAISLKRRWRSECALMTRVGCLSRLCWHLATGLEHQLAQYQSKAA